MTPPDTAARREITQHQLDRARLVLVVGDDGLYDWYSALSKGEAAALLEAAAAAIRAEIAN
jgi:hypothetical protein